MNIDKFKYQHVEILDAIAALRALVQGGIAEYAAEIAERIIAMSSIVKLRLSVEDKLLYPALERNSNTSLARMSAHYRTAKS